MDDKVSREVKLNAAKEIVNAYIRSAVVKTGEDSRPDINPTQVCDLFRQVYQTIDEVLPNQTRKVGLG